MKFRAWDITEKCWIPEDFLAITAKGELLTYEPAEDRWAIDIICWALSRSTEIKDVNGKAIFEGDIIQLEKYYRAPMPVEYRNGYWKIIMRDGDPWGDLTARYHETRPKVIGNIYENPELLT